jgi:hypothetical protein
MYRQIKETVSANINIITYSVTRKLTGNSNWLTKNSNTDSLSY